MIYHRNQVVKNLWGEAKCPWEMSNFLQGDFKDSPAPSASSSYSPYPLYTHGHTHTHKTYTHTHTMLCDIIYGEMGTSIHPR